MVLRSGFMAALSGCALLVCSLPAHAVPINYGDFIGSTVNFIGVTEDSGTHTPPLYGAPSVFGDTLDFNPISFNAGATGAGGVEITDGTLSLMMTSKAGNFIDKVLFDEAGDVTLAGIGGIGTFASVTANFNVEIQEVDGVGIGSILIAVPMVFTPSGGTYDLATDAGGGPFYNSAWSGSLMVDLTQALIDNNIPYVNGVTKISVVFDNTLTAISENGTSAFIAKKDVGGVGITVFPEPASLGLLMLGGACLLGRRN
ncbi:MAG: PEP-CTERM sorting domain-containing protein [Phycisphaerales bacterium]